MHRRPEPSEYAPYFQSYLELVPEDDILAALGDQVEVTSSLLGGVDEERAGYRYAPGKWTVRQVVGHMGDTERILAFRALSISRGETNPLPGYDEDSYVRGANFDSWPYADLIDSLGIIRRANILMFRHLSPEAWDRRGLANRNATTVRGLAYTILGHERHHLRVLRERYGIPPAP
ncbi:MAG TPA: DinB family protein [Thermoanaerobaculia bacterium]|nr:DinB family protein [Thermoanaerobaculia bacterium]